MFKILECCFDCGASLTGFVLQVVSLISMASVQQDLPVALSKPSNHTFVNIITEVMNLV